MFDPRDFCLSTLYCSFAPLKTEIHLNYITMTDQLKIFRVATGAHSENHIKCTIKNMTNHSSFLTLPCYNVKEHMRRKQSSSFS